MPTLRVGEEPNMPEDTVRAATNAYLQVQFAALRHAIDAEDDDHLIRIVDHIRAEVGGHTARSVIADLLRLARNPITDAASAACIETAMQRYQARYGRIAPGRRNATGETT
ncbi:MAG: hypothetical protein GEV04_24065 [Actinophytocola sp.]|nr:hypothetical protein [Actinophytocola sp.]